jgi:hypothetical protein
MRGQPVARTVSWALLLLVVSSLLWTSAADEPNQAGVVVQFADGRVETRCVSFEEDEITGAELLALSGLDAVVDPSSGGECAYWNYFYRDAGQAAWTYSALGAAIHKTKPGSVEGWVWGDGHSPPAEELTLEVICAAPSPEPTATSEPATAVPVTASASPSDTPGPTALPTDLPATTAPSPIPTRPVPSPGPAMEQGAEPSSGPSSYLPFGLMVVGLAVIGGLVWLWRR